jgi:hypothetical protein
MLRPSRTGKPKAPPPPSVRREGDPAPLLAVASDALIGNRRSHTVGDYVWLAITLSTIAAAVVFWPVWDRLIGSEELDHFSVLGVAPTADSGVVKRAYRSLARQWHPDHNPGCGEECRERMRMIQEAYRAVSDNPEAAAAPKADDGSGFNATLLHLFLGRLFDMVFYFAEFVVCIAPSVGFTQGNTYRGALLLVGFITLHLYLTSVRVSLSWVGIAVCLWKFKKLADWAPPLRASQQLGYLVWLVLPTCATYVWFVRRYQTALPADQFALNLVAGVIYLTGALIRSRAQLGATYHIKRVPHLPPRLLASLLWDYACTDLLAYTIKIPPPFRIAPHLVALAVIYQRWIYIHVDRTRLNEFGRIIGVEGAEAAQYPGLQPALPMREREEREAAAVAAATAERDPTPRPPPTEPKNETREERIARQRQDAPGTSRSLWLLVAGIVLLFLSIGAAGFAYQWSTGDPGAPADPTDLPFRPHPPKPEKPPRAAGKGKAGGQGPKTKTGASSASSGSTKGTRSKNRPA